VFSAGNLSVVDCVFSKGNAVASGAGVYMSKDGSQLAYIANRLVALHLKLFRTSDATFLTTKSVSVAT
jgi:hypothetical protein